MKCEIMIFLLLIKVDALFAHTGKNISLSSTTMVILWEQHGRKMVNMEDSTNKT